MINKTDMILNNVTAFVVSFLGAYFLTYLYFEIKKARERIKDSERRRL